MSWFKVDDRLCFHPKVLAAGNAAMGLWVRAGSWCAGFPERNGKVSAEILKSLGASLRDANRLVEVGLWSKDGDDFQFHDWEEFQPSKQQVDARKEATRKRVAKHRNAKRNAASNAVNSEGVTALHDESNAVTNGVPVPVPIEEVAKAPSSKGGAGGKLTPEPAQESAAAGGAGEPAAEAAQQTAKKPSKRATQLPADWAPTPRHAEIAAERGIWVSVEAEKFRDYCAATGKTYRDHDAAFRNWLRNAKPSPLSENTPQRDELAEQRRRANRDKDRAQREAWKASASPPTQEFLDLKTRFRKGN